MAFGGNSAKMNMLSEEEEESMTTSLWIIIAVVSIVCIIIFKKTVTNDAENDFKIRDVLSRPDLSEEENSLTETFNNEVEPQSIQKPMSQEMNKQLYTEPENIYENLQKQQYEAEYKTNIHEETVMEKSLNHSYQEQKSDKEDDDSIHYDKDFSYEIKKEKTPVKKKNNMFDYVRIFWRGITFAIGVLVCLYSLLGLTHYVQTSNDAIIYSLWLLIGVILVK